ncbi:hypothetical protein Bbelb_359120 [Branchiostoma belcheri]|nr:hypothetical protein Bbelb_359120 [Branchiostoma belcheri]
MARGPVGRAIKAKARSHGSGPLHQSRRHGQRRRCDPRSRPLSGNYGYCSSTTSLPPVPDFSCLMAKVPVHAPPPTPQHNSPSSLRQTDGTLRLQSWCEKGPWLRCPTVVTTPALRMREQSPRSLTFRRKFSVEETPSRYPGPFNENQGQTSGTEPRGSAILPPSRPPCTNAWRA